MLNNKIKNKSFFEYVGLCLIVLFIVIHGIVRSDSFIAMISAICGITYTFLAGKGRPVCYFFGVAGSSFYAFLSYQNALWGNLLLYLAYYVPMQVLGYFRWNKNLKISKKEIVKMVLPRKEFFCLLLILAILTILLYFILSNFKDAHPLLDSITTVFSIGGMYLTVRRTIEQWVFWMVVNALSLYMWIDVALDGVRVYSTILMWAVYLFLAVYFYSEWRKELTTR